MGASKIGDIKELAQIALPNYAIITNIGKAYLEGFGSIKNIQKLNLNYMNMLLKIKVKLL